MKKLIPALLTLCFLLTSCSYFTLEYTITGDTTVDLSVQVPQTSYTEITPKPPVTLPGLDGAMSADKQLSTLPDMDFAEKYFGKDNEDGVAYFIIATVNDAPVFADADELSGSCVAATLNAVEYKYNVDIINLSYTADEFDAKIKESEQTGVYFADLLSLPADAAKTYGTSEYCKNLSTLPFVSKNSPYFVSEFSRLGGGLSDFAVMSNASYLTRDLQCLYFDASGVSDEIYSKALDGELSWEYILSLADKTGRGIASNPNFEDIFRLTSGARYKSDGKNSVLTTSPFQTPAEGTAADGLNAAIAAATARISDENPLFVIDTIGNYAKYMESSTRYGILPLPSYDGSATVGFVSPDKVNYFLCPSHTTTAEGAGLIMSALGAASAQREAEVFITLIRDSARDNGTLLVSHLLFSAPAWDFEYAYPTVGDDPADNQ